MSTRRPCLPGSVRPKSGYTLLELMIVLAIFVSISLVAWPRITGRLQVVGPREAALQLKAELSEARERAVSSGEPWAVRIERGSGKYEMGPVSAFRQRETTFAAKRFDNGPFVVGAPSGTAPSPQLEHAANPTASVASIDDVQQQRIESFELPPGMRFDDGHAHATYEANLVRDEEFMRQQQLQEELRRHAEATSMPRQIGNPTEMTNASPSGETPTPLGNANNWKYVLIYQPDGRATEAEIRLKEDTTDNRIRLHIRGFTSGVTIDAVEQKDLTPQQPSTQGGGLERIDPANGVPLLPGNETTPLNELAPNSPSGAIP